jgi:L-amino acid N-acyltransferase YncA
MSTVATTSPTLKRTYPRTVDLHGAVLELSRLGPRDRDEVLAFARGLSEEDLLFLRMDITRDDVVDDWIRSQANDQRVTILARIDGQLVGYGSLNREPASWTRHLGEIRIIVSSSQRARGLGALLTREIVRIASELGLSKVIARMPLRQEGARRMFERLGFSAEALLADWVVDRAGTTHDLVIMGYDVTSLTF